MPLQRTLQILASGAPLSEAISALSGFPDLLTEFGCDVAEHVLPEFEKIRPEEKAPRLAIEAARAKDPFRARKAEAARQAAFALHKDPNYDSARILYANAYWAAWTAASSGGGHGDASNTCELAQKTRHPYHMDEESRQRRHLAALILQAIRAGSTPVEPQSKIQPAHYDIPGLPAPIPFTAVFNQDVFHAGTQEELLEKLADFWGCGPRKAANKLHGLQQEAAIVIVKDYQPPRWPILERVKINISRKQHGRSDHLTHTVADNPILRYFPWYAHAVRGSLGGHGEDEATFYVGKYRSLVWWDSGIASLSLGRAFFPYSDIVLHGHIWDQLYQRDWPVIRSDLAGQPSFPRLADAICWANSTGKTRTELQTWITNHRTPTP